MVFAQLFTRVSFQPSVYFNVFLWRRVGKGEESMLKTADESVARTLTSYK